jgi:DNA-binding MarR family transcriptional regulator
MGEGIRKRLLQNHFDSSQHEALLNLLLAAAHVRESLDATCQRHGVTRGQYNVLRILRGVHPEGYSRCEIGRRLIERAPDVTRLIDRLEQQGWIERRGSDRDRRLSMAYITRPGLELLERMQPDVMHITDEIAGRLTADDAEALSCICERLYDAPAAEAAPTENEVER